MNNGTIGITSRLSDGDHYMPALGADGGGSTGGGVGVSGRIVKLSERAIELVYII